MEISTPLITWFLGVTRISPKRHLDRFIRFCIAQHTDRHIDHATCDIRSSRLHLMHCVQATRPNNSIDHNHQTVRHVQPHDVHKTAHALYQSKDCK